VTGCTALTSLLFYQNNISGENMDFLISTLPNVSKGNMCVIYNEGEGNVITASQVADAKIKGWKTLCTSDGTTSKEYAGSEEKKCANPTIAFIDNKLTYSCETEGVEIHYEYSFPQGSKGIGSESAMLQTIIVSVYATKVGYEDSDVVTKEIAIDCATGIRGDVNEDGNVNGTDIQEVINIIVNGE
jgi:hypothetical protein